MTNIQFKKEEITIWNNGQEELTIPLNLEGVNERFLLAALNLAKSNFNQPQVDKQVELDEDGLYIYEDETKEDEVVMWNLDEMMEDKEVVLSVFNALNLLYKEGIDAIKKRIA